MDFITELPVLEKCDQLWVSRSCLDYSVRLDRQRRLSVFGAGAPTHTSGVLTLPAYSHFRRAHASGVLTRHSYSHALRGFVVLVVSVTPGVLFVALVLTRSAWSCRLLTHLAWARCSRGIRHTQRALRRVRTNTLCVILSAFSHTLHGLIVLAVSITPSVVSSRSSHTPCMGSLFSLGLVVAAPVHG